MVSVGNWNILFTIQVQNDNHHPEEKDNKISNVNQRDNLPLFIKTVTQREFFNGEPWYPHEKLILYVIDKNNTLHFEIKFDKVKVEFLYDRKSKKDIDINAEDESEITDVERAVQIEHVFRSISFILLAYGAIETMLSYFENRNKGTIWVSAGLGLLALGEFLGWYSFVFPESIMYPISMIIKIGGLLSLFVPVSKVPLRKINFDKDLE